jgi:DNA-binding NarL/FixJ family response regulator
MSNSPIRVYIVDDHLLVQEGIKALLQSEPSFEFVGNALTAEKCLTFFTEQKADVILMDISLPEMDGVQLCSILTEKFPTLKILALSTHNQGTYIRKMMENGAMGYLFKNANKSEIVKAITTVYRGEKFLTHDAENLLRQENLLQSQIPKLTKREKEVLALVASGMTNGQISERLFVSIDTVDSHRKNLHTKLNVKNTAQLIKVAGELNLL